MIKKKVSIQDIVPSQKHRSIQDISMADVGREVLLGEKSRKNMAIGENQNAHRFIELPEDKKHHDFHREYISHSNKPRWGMVAIWLLIILACLGCFLFVSSFFHGAIVNIKIREVVADLDTSVNLTRKDEVGVLPFEIVSLNKVVGEFVPTKGEKEISVKATGKVIVYNKNTTSQKLMSQTRLEATNGKIFRLRDTVVVAGAKKVGKNLIPGSVEITALADVAGSEYNIALTDFTIPGFKDTAKFDSIYARSKTNFTGGASGIVKIAEVEDLSKAQVLVKDSLEKQLLNGVNQQIPNSFVLLPGVYSIQYASSTQETKGDTLTLRQEAEFVGVLVDLKKISSFLAKKAIPGYSGEDVLVDNMKDISFEYITGSTTLNVNTDKLSLKIKGKPHFIYGYDSEKLKGDLVGISRESFATVIATYPAIEKGNSEIDPFWRSRFPIDFSRIIIKEEK
jgi:hypothetical protein